MFNGAEESLQDASHGFIVNHRLREKTALVLNLEGCGNSGKAILFQIGEGSLIEVYARVPYPTGTVAVRFFLFFFFLFSWSATLITALSSSGQ